MKKLGLLLAASAVVLFMVGCAEKAPATQPTTTHTMHGKLGRMSTSHDTMK